MAAQGLTVSDWLRRKTLPGTGWVSHRGKGKSGNLLLERLPKDEWSSQRFHETTVAHRVATLHNMYAISGMARRHSPAARQLRAEKKAAAAGELSPEAKQGREEHKRARRRDDWVTRELGVDEPTCAAMGALMACTEGSQAALLLARLEGTPREEWEVVVETWERWQQQERERLVAISAEEKRQAEQQDAPGRVFACIDRALEMHSARQEAAAAAQEEAEAEAEAAAAKGGSPVAASPRPGPARSGRRVRATTPDSSDTVSAQSSVAAAESPPPPQPQPQPQSRQPAKVPLMPTPPTTPAKEPGARADPIDISKLKSEGLGGGGSCASPAWLATRADDPDGCAVAATATATTTARQPPPRPRRLAARAA